MPGFATLAMVNLDSADPPALAAFYAGMLGWEITHSQAEYAMVSSGATHGGSTSIGFGLVADYDGPGWPQERAPKRYHLDFYVDDLDKAEERALALGATRVSAQPEPQRWRVLLDPGGHPFDLCPHPPTADA